MQSDNGNDKHIILHIFGGGLIRSSLEVIEGGLGSTVLLGNPKKGFEKLSLGTAVLHAHA